MEMGAQGPRPAFYRHGTLGSCAHAEDGAGGVRVAVR